MRVARSPIKEHRRSTCWR